MEPMRIMGEENQCKSDMAPPQTRWDFSLAYVALAASVAMIAANVVVVVQRRRRRIRLKGGATLTVTASVAGLAWIASSFIINFHFRRDDPFLLLCPLWTFWIYLSFGFCLWLACLILRLYRLTSSTSFTTASTLASIFLLWLPSCVFAVVATASSAISPQQEEKAACAKFANCEIKDSWKYCTFLILPLSYFLMLLILLFRCKGSSNRSAMNEYSHIAEYSMMAFVIYLLYGVDIVTGSYKKISGRCFLTFCICYVVFSEFWVRMGPALYHLCTCKDASQMDSLPDELMDSSMQDPEWILNAISNAKQDIAEHKATIDQLEQKRDLLLDKIKQLEETTTLLISSHM